MMPVAGHVAQASPGEPLLAFVLRLRAEKIAALLAETTPAATARTRTAGTGADSVGVGVSTASPALLDAICRLLALIDAPGDAAVLAPGVEREVLWRLITGPQGTLVRQIGLADSRLAHLARAISWIRRHYDQTLRVEDLAALATMSVTSFHRHFRFPPSLPRADLDDPHPVPEADPPARGPGQAPGRARGHRRHGFRGGATAAPPSSAGSTAACSAPRPAATRSPPASGRPRPRWPGESGSPRPARWPRCGTRCPPTGGPARGSRPRPRPGAARWSGGAAPGSRAAPAPSTSG